MMKKKEEILAKRLFYNSVSSVYFRLAKLLLKLQFSLLILIPYNHTQKFNHFSVPNRETNR